MKIMKIIEFHLRKKHIYENARSPRQIYENHENLKIPCKNHETHEDLRIPYREKRKSLKS